MIKIISGWSNPGGSTTAFINLTNAFNEFGYDAEFYGPHNWHLDKCKSKQYTPNSKLQIDKDDILIIHFINKFQYRPQVRGFFLSCHEQNIFPLKEINYKIFDKIHYVSEHQKQYHDINHPFFILPNVLDDLKPSPVIDKKIGGIIGSIDRNKQVHVSISKALKDGCEKVYLYGNITDPLYWHNEVADLVDGEKVIYKGYEENKQRLYDSISDVYQDSIMETWGYVKGECKLTNTVYNGNDSTNGYWEMDKKDIIYNWIKELKI